MRVPSSAGYLGWASLVELWTVDLKDPGLKPGRRRPFHSPSIQLEIF